jgi:DNA-binding FadR family transcriptional regulator
MTIYRRPDPIPRPRTQVLKPLVVSPLILSGRDDLRQLVAKRIFVGIESGQFPEGSLLPNERTLCESLGVSRTALREAINGLASKGLLDARRKRGTLVLDRTYWNMLDADLISWTRNNGRASVSDELWQAVSAALPVVARMAAAHRGDASLSVAASAIDQDPVDQDILCAFLIALSRAGLNRFLGTVVSVGLRSLLTEDPAFVRRIARPGAAAHLRLLAEAVESADGPAAEHCARQFCDINAVTADVMA